MGMGALLAIGAWWHWRRGGGGDPLRGSPLRPNRMLLIHVWACVCANFLGWWLGGQLAVRLAPAGLEGDRLLHWQGGVAAVVANGLTLLTCATVGAGYFVGGLRGVGLVRRSFSADVAWGVGGWLVATFLTGGLLQIIDWLIRMLAPDFQPPEHPVFRILNDPASGRMIRLLSIAGALIFAPLGEEFIFRGILQTALHRVLPSKWGSLRHRWVAIAIAGTLFGAAHSSTPHFIPALAALGMLLGFIYERTGSLRACILVHFLFNGRSLLWDYLAAT